MIVTVTGGPLTLELYADNDSICDNSSTILNAVATGGSEAYTYTWSPAEGLDDANAANTTFTPGDIFEAYRNYTFYCEVSDGYNTITDTVSVTVFDFLTADAGNDTSIVKNTVAGLRALIPNGVNADNFLFRWTPEDLVADDESFETQTEQLGQTTTFTLTVTNKYYDDCSSSDEKTVMVYDQAVADFTADDVCLGDTTYFSFTGSVIPGAEYSWNFGDGSGTSNLKDPYYVYGTAGQFEVFMTVSTADSDSTISKSVNVYEIPVANFSADEVCFGNETTLTADEVDNATYNWDFDNDGSIDASTTDNLVHYAFANAGLHTVALTVVSEHGCVSDSVNRSVRVHFAPVADAGPDQTVNYKDIATLTGDDGTDAGYDEFIFRWTPADMVTDADSYSTQTLQLAETTMFYLTVTNRYSNDCYSVDSVMVTVEGGPLTAEMTVDSDSICENGSTKISVNAANGVGNYQYSWEPAEYFMDVTDAVTTFIPDDIYNISEVVTITCTVTSGDETVVVSQDVTVFDYLDANAGNDTTVVHNTVATLKAIVPDGVNADNFSFRWEPDSLLINPDSLSTETVRLTDNTAFTLTVTNKDFNACSSSNEMIVEVGPELLIETIAATDTAICDNSSTLLGIVVSGGSDDYTYSWTPTEYLDDPESANPIFTPDFIENINESITFICTIDDGYNTIMDSVTVMVYKYQQSNAGKDTIISYNTTAELRAIFDTRAIEDNFIYRWEPADLVVDPDAYVTSTVNLTETTVFTLTTTNKLSDLCISTDQIIIEVGEQLKLDVNAIDNDTIICEGNSVSLTTIVSGGICDTCTYIWSSNNGGFFDNETSATPIFTPDYFDEEFKEYYLTCTIDNCGEQISDSILVTVYKTPKAEFTTDNVCLGDTVRFHATEFIGATYTWNFGDGTSVTSISNDTLHYYTNDGIYNVTLVVTSDKGCVSEIAIDSVEVFEIPVAEFSADDVCFGEAVTFYATAVEGATYTWNFGDGSADIETTTPTTTYEYSEANQVNGYEVTLIVTSEHGCESNVVTNTIKVFEALEANAGPDQIIPYGTKTTIGAIIPDSVNADNFNFQWEPANLLVNPNSLTTETKYHMITPQTFTLTVTNKLNSNCSSTDEVFIDIVGDALVITDTICDDGVSYPDGKYWLFDETGWGFAFPGRYQGEGDVTIDEYGNLMKVKYDITLLNELEASEIGLGGNAQMVYHLGLGFDFYVFDIIEVTGGGTDEDIDGFENVKETYDWTLEMIDGGTPWTLDQSADSTNIMSINVKSDGSAYLRCYISSLCGTIEKWILLYTPGYEPCRNVSDLQAIVTNSTTAEIKWQSTTDKYEVRYGTDYRCTESVITTNNHLTIEDLEPNTTYYWKVRAICEDETLNIGFVDGPTFITYDIAMYPNPALDKVTIEGKNLNSVELYNALGVMIYSEKNIVNNMTTINTSSFSRGLYFVRYTLNNGTTNIMRLVIE